MNDEIKVIRVYAEDLGRLRRQYPKYKSDADRLHEFMLTVVTVTTLPRPMDATPVPVVEIGHV